MNNIKYVCLLLLMATTLLVEAQDFSPFVQSVWNNNHELKSQSFELDQARLAFEEAKATYLPSIGFGTQYTLAAGGRAIDFPVGDLLNPVYSALNELTGNQNFPTLENQSILFLPNNFYDARFRIQQPVYYPDLAINRQAKLKQQELKSIEIKAYKRLLVKNLMEAYFQWKQAGQAIEIYRQAEDLLQEAARSTNSMIRNGVALPSARSRIEGELATVQAQQIEAVANEENAFAYLQFVLGDKTISRDQLQIEIPELPEESSNESQNREELIQLDLGLELDQLKIDQENNFFKPQIGLQLDLGSQDFNFGWKPYGLLGVNLQWSLFDGNRHQLRRQQALTGMEIRKEQKKQVEEQFALQLGIARRNLTSGINQAETFRPRIEAAERTYRDILRKYSEGSANYLELLDARIQLTQSQISYLLARYQAWAKWSEYQYSSALYPID